MKEPLWVPSPERAQCTAMTRFIRFVNDRCSTAFANYNELYRWSVSAVKHIKFEPVFSKLF